MRVNKIVSAIILICFLLNIAVSDLAFGLATPSALDDMVGIQHKDMGRIKLALEEQLVALVHPGLSVNIDTFQTILKEQNFKEKTIFQPADMQFFFHETKLTNTGLCVMVRLKDKYGLRTYYATFSLQKDEKGGFPIGVYTEEQYKGTGRVKYERTVEIEKHERAQLSSSQEKIIRRIQKILEGTKGRDDYFMKPTIVGNGANIKENDSIIFTNFRGDRAEPMDRCLTSDPDFKHFPLKQLNPIVAPFAVYSDKYFKASRQKGIITEPIYTNTLSEVLAKNGLTQVSIAESEKFKHVTYFFDGKREQKFTGVESVQIASNEIGEHWRMPKMKAQEIAEEAKKWISGEEGRDKKDFVLLNFANLDILGHFDRFDAIVDGALAVDEAVGIIRETVKKAGGVLIVTADHGSGEQKVKLDERGMPLLDQNGNVRSLKSHTFDNKVPFIIEGIGNNVKLKERGSLKNVAPTVLELMGIKRPGEITAESLLENYTGGQVKGPVVMIVRDGWGLPKFVNPEALKWNAVEQARLRCEAAGKKFNDTELTNQNSHTELLAHGKAVGLPDYQMGDSENGHLNLGAGRDVESPLLILDEMLKTEEFAKNEIFRKALDNAKNGHTLHIIGMLSEGGVHSHPEHLFKMLNTIAKERAGLEKIVIHLIFDGRDVETSEKAGWQSLEELFHKINELGLQDITDIGVIAGRYYPMDRDALSRDKKGKPSTDLWKERVKPWYDAIVHNEGPRLEDIAPATTTAPSATQLSRYYEQPANARAFADAWDKEVQKEVERNRNKFLSLVPEGILIDAGTGSGRDAAYFLTQGRQVIGVDKYEAMLEEARKRHPEVAFVKMDMSSLGMGNGRVAGVWNNAALIHLKPEEARQAVTEFFRVLATQGILFLRVKRGDGEIVDEKGRYIKLYQQQELEALLLSVGFEIIESAIRKDSATSTQPKRDIEWIDIFARKQAVAPAPSAISTTGQREIDTMILLVSGSVLEIRQQISTHPSERYNLLVTSEFFANGELDEHRAKYGDRFDLDRVSGGSLKQFVDNILAKAAGKETKTIALVPNDLPAEQLEKLTKVGIRFVRVNALDLQKAKSDKDANREKFQVDTYATMLLLRRIDNSITADSSIYKLLSFYLKSHFSLTDRIAIDDYIMAIINKDVTRLIKGCLSYRPAQPYETPNYNNVAASLISA